MWNKLYLNKTNNKMKKQTFFFVLPLIFSLIVMNQFVVAQPPGCPQNQVCLKRCTAANGGGCYGGYEYQCVDLLKPNKMKKLYYDNGWWPCSAGSVNALKSSRIDSVKIYDIRGLLVQTIIDRKFEQGEQSLRLAVTNINTGIYFLRMQTADSVQTR